MKWIQRVLLKIQSGHDSVHRRTDRQDETSIPPFQLRWSWGYNKINPGYLPLAPTALKLQQIPLFLIFPLQFGGTSDTVSPNIRTVGFCVKIALILQWKCLCVPDCTYLHESMQKACLYISSKWVCVIYIVSLLQAMWHIHVTLPKGHKSYSYLVWPCQWLALMRP